MAEARRAILALREDAAGATPPTAAGRPDGRTPGSPAAEQLTARLRTLADQHRADGDAPVEFTVTGTPRPLGPEAALTAFRTAQEALTNARKHAPGQPAALEAAYTPDAMTLTVSSPLPAPGPDGPLAGAGSGYGLTGLRERAALAGGTLAAGPDGGQWLVSLRLPG
jgi:signal transduction histidine kinase